MSNVRRIGHICLKRSFKFVSDKRIINIRMQNRMRISKDDYALSADLMTSEILSKSDLRRLA